MPKSPKQTKLVNHLLVRLMEESAEVTQACSKALRFGLHDRYKEFTPLQQISAELDDVRVIIQLLQKQNKELDEALVPHTWRQRAFKEKVKLMIKYSKKKGML